VYTFVSTKSSGKEQYYRDCTKAILFVFSLTTEYTHPVRQLRTIRCKLSVDLANTPILIELFTRYAKACSDISKWGRDHKEENAVRLHHALYYNIRKKYSLPASLVVTALRHSSGALKAAKMHGKFQYRPTFVCLDVRTFTLKLNKGVVTFSSHEGRKTAKLEIGKYQRDLLIGQKPTSATLVRAKNGFYCNISIENEVPDVAVGGTLGVDLGIRKVAVVSTGMKFFGKSLREYREHRWKVRASLQSHGTRGAKRLLRRLSGKEARHVAWINHRIAKAIVAEAVKAGASLIRMEDLKGIRDRLRIPNKHRNRMMSLWSFFQLQSFIEYKAALKGIRFERINPAYTSQTCHKCKKPGLRDKETFCCTPCGLTMDADLNAALVIAAGGVEPGDNPGDRNATQIARHIVEFFSHSA